MDAIQIKTSQILQQMRNEIAADSSVFAGRLRPEGRLQGAAGFSSLFTAACGTDVAGAGLYRLGLEYIYEGYLLHYGQSRLLEEEDGEFHVLAGDHMFARGLAAIAGLGDLFCVRTLAELIRRSAFIQCEGLDPSLAFGAWAASTLQLAAHAQGRADVNGEPATAVPNGAGRDAWKDAGLGEPGRRLDELLAAYPEGKRKDLREIINNLEDGFLQKHRR